MDRVVLGSAEAVLGEAGARLIAACDAALGIDNPALALEALHMVSVLPEGGAILASGETVTACRRLLARTIAEVPLSTALIGFDRPANLYLVTGGEMATAAATALHQIILSRPDERHVVLFTGAADLAHGLGPAQVKAWGGFALCPDAEAVLYDRWLWLREKLAAFAVRRLFVLAAADDVVAALAVMETAPHLGRRLYLMHPAEAPLHLAPELAAATHLVASRTRALHLRADHPGLSFVAMPAANGLAEAAGARPGRIGLGRPVVTLTAGPESDFVRSGDLAFPAAIVRILALTGGYHLHAGRVSPGLYAAVAAALVEAEIDLGRFEFLGEVPVTPQLFASRKVGLFLGAFPHAGTAGLAEAAQAGVPVALCRSGTGEDGGAETLVWSDLAGLERLLRDWPSAQHLTAQVQAARDWARRRAPLRFRRRLLALIAATEGRFRPLPADAAARAALVAPLFDRDFYNTVNSDVAASGVDPLQHFLAHGEAEHRLPNRLFDPAFYLAGLPAAEREKARDLPFTHYLARGEAMGHAPHPLFDPTLCRISLDRAAPPAKDQAPGPVLSRYLGSGGRVVPHMFFDPTHYVSQLPYPPEDVPLLLHYLDSDAEQMLSPHPLIQAEALAVQMGLGREGHQRALLDWLQGKGRDADAVSPHPLFDAGHFGAGADVAYGAVAPNLLWAHLIEGNRRGRDPHVLIAPAHVEGLRPGTLIEAGSLLLALAANRLGVSTHPLISNAHIEAQVPWIATGKQSPTAYYLAHGADHNIDPHPWVSTQYYFWRNPELAGQVRCPLAHFLAAGQEQGRLTHRFFDGNVYYAEHLKAVGGGSPLVHYARHGAGRFLATLPQDAGLQRLTEKTVRAQFRLEAQEKPKVDGKGRIASAAADMLQDLLHPEPGGTHPTLLCECRQRRVAFPEAGEDLRELRKVAPAADVTVLRPAVVSVRHLTPPSGRTQAPAIVTGLFPEATVVAGNDGFLAASGIWQDCGLAGLDAETMAVKPNGAVFATEGDLVLLRRHRDGDKFAAGIFACGTLSRSPLNFLIEVLPRALVAAEQAPEGVPVLTDDDMPAAHYQALRLMLPGRPILRLARHRSHRVERLYAASMPGRLHNAAASADVPVEAVAIHPEIVRRYAAFAVLLCPPGLPGRLPQRLFLARARATRQFLNAGQLEAELVRRDFTPLNLAAESFADQLRHVAGARAIVGQSAAHLAMIAFARPGTRVFPIASNAPGTDFNLWPALGNLAGVEVINVVGWRLPGSAEGRLPAAEEHFSLPVHLITSYFPLPVTGDDPVRLLDALRVAGDEADALTSAWAIRAEPTPPGFETRLASLRRSAVAAIVSADDDDLQALLDHPVFSDPWATSKSGLRALTDHDDAEKTVIADLHARFDRLAVGTGKDSDDDLRRMMLLAMLLLPAWHAPLIAAPEDLPTDVQPHYLRWIAQPPFVFRAGEDEGYVAYIARLLTWIDRQLAPDRPAKLRFAVARVAAELDLSQLLLIEAPLTEVFAARNRVLDRIALAQGQPRRSPRPADGSQGRRRIGVLFRTFDKGPDSEAVVAVFRAFDRARYEVFGYSIGFRDRVAAADSSFDRDFDAAIEHRRQLSSDPAELRAQLLADDLDFLLFANATTYGLKTMEMALYHRVAPVQAVANSHLPMSLGFASFDAYITGLSDHADHEVDQAGYPERLLRCKGPVISYLNSLKPRSRPPLDRLALGLAEDDLVMMNAGSLQKLRHECLVTMMRAVKDVPKGVLLLAPHNPGWAARSQAFAFNRQLEETAAEVGLPADRIRVLSEMTVAETEAALSCADIYLNPFPHGGATMTHLALIYGVPPVTLRRRSTRSIDQFLIGSLGFPELLADTPDDYVALAQALAGDAGRRKALAAALRKAASNPPFVDSPDYSRTMQAAMEELFAAAEPSAAGKADA